jgi:hypothetical protein
MWNAGGMLGFGVSVAWGAIAGGFVVARTARRHPYPHSVVVVALLWLLDVLYRFWEPPTLWDNDLFSGNLWRVELARAKRIP